ncbi:MAG: hypothetical protein IPP85_01495 [Propionivibrio sp.]|nr:hypothetical protein [Propionivibrio sp.]
MKYAIPCFIAASVATPKAPDNRADVEALDNIAAIAAAVFVVMDGAPHRIINYPALAAVPRDRGRANCPARLHTVR